MSILPAGTRIGLYEILAPLGAGGMGEVYRARDTKLGRDVAFKILPASFASDSDRLMRFEREAKTLAALNHPQIAQIYGFEQSTAVSALVIELVEGEDLSQRLSRGAIPIDDALPIARQVADALEAAHEQGIVHRDLKPANIKVRADGVVKILDFGLAKAMESLPAGATPASPLRDSPTITSPAFTAAGMILGTAAYMSPEQAKGRVVDRRSDIWAFGCVLFEMLTGRRAFPGDDVTETLASVIKSDPDWSALPATTPASLRRLLTRALQKDHRLRLADIHDARLELDDAREAPVAVATAAARQPTAYLPWILAAVATIVAIALAVLNTRERSEPPIRVVRSIVLPPSELTGSPAVRLALSPDGRTLAFPARDDKGTLSLWIRPLEATTGQPLAGTEGASAPFWSPDSRHLAFIAGGKLKRVPAAGGPVITLADAAPTPPGAWSPSGVIVFSPSVNSPLFQIPAGGGTPTPATKLDDGDPFHTFPRFLGDGRRFLFAGSRGQLAVRVGSLDSLETRDIQLVNGAVPANVQYAAGHILFTQGSTLMLQRLDENALRVVGDPIPVAQDVLVTGLTGGTGAFSVSPAGVLVYQSRDYVSSQPTWFDRNGRFLEAVGGAGVFGGLTLAGDGRTAVVAAEQRSYLTLDLVRGVNRRLAVNAEGVPITLSGDGKSLFYRRKGKQGVAIFSKPAGGEGPERPVLEDANSNGPLSVSSDGNTLLYAVSVTPTRAELWTLPLTGGHPSRYLDTLVHPNVGEFSPDNRFVVFVSNESGQNEVWAASFPKPEGRWQISSGGGMQPRWAADGKSLLYVVGTRLVSTAVDASGPALQTGNTKALFDLQADSPVYMYGVASDGRILALINQRRDVAPIHLVTGWPALLTKPQ